MIGRHGHSAIRGVRELIEAIWASADAQDGEQMAQLRVDDLETGPAGEAVVRGVVVTGAVR
jgi:hypothetical protein